MNEALLKDTVLVKPLIIEIYQELAAAGQLAGDAPLPKNKAELLRMIRGLVRRSN